MTLRMPTVLVLSALIIGLGGCSLPPPPSGTPAPSAPVPARPIDPVVYMADVTLSGVVFEETPTGRAAIESVGVYCEPCGAETHSWASTDANGFYTFTGVWIDPAHFPTRIWIGKDGYLDPPGLPPTPLGGGWREVVINGNTQFDVQLVRR
jgi:hypothetical protein